MALNILKNIKRGAEDLVKRYTRVVDNFFEKNVEGKDTVPGAVLSPLNETRKAIQESAQKGSVKPIADRFIANLSQSLPQPLPVVEKDGKFAVGGTPEQRQEVFDKALSFDTGGLNVVGSLLKKTLPQITKNIASKGDDVARKIPVREAVNVSRGVTGKAQFKNIADDDLGEVLDFIDNSTLRKPSSIDNEIAARRIAERVGINPNQSNGELADKFRKAIEKTPEVRAKAVERGKMESRAPSEAFGAVAGIERDEEGNITFNPEKAALGVLGTTAATKFDADKYVKRLVQGRETARITPANKATQFLKDVKRKLIDFAAPIEDTLREAQEKYKFSLLPSQDISNQIDRVLRAPSLAGQFVRDNGLEAIIKNVDDVDNLDQFLIARHAQTLEAKGITTGRDLAQDQLLLQEFSPQYKEMADQVVAYSRKILDYSVDRGLISDELATKLKEIYPDYVPMNRVFNELERSEVFSRKGIANLSSQSIVQKIQGSEREIESPLGSILAKTSDAFAQGEKNAAARLLADYRNLPGFSDLIKELPKDQKAPHTFSYLDNGVKRTFETTKEIAEAAKALNVQQLNILGRILAAPVRLAKIGITGINLPFVGANVARDQLFAAVTSQNTLKTSIANPVVFVRSLLAAFKHDDLYDELIRQGGGFTSFDIARNQPSQTIDRIRSGRDAGSKIKYVIRHPSELLRAVEDIVGRSEEFTRIQQFEGTRRALRGQGLPENEALAGGARAARENTANFSRRGEWGHVLNSAFLYLNAGIQGSRSFLRAFDRNPTGTAAKVGMFIFTPMAVSTLWNLNDPQRREAYEDIADYEKENNFIFIPPNPTKDENGKWNVIKIPLPPGLGKLALPVRRFLEGANGLDPLRTGEILNALVGSVSPIDLESGSLLSTLTPQAIKPTLEATTNQNFFTGFPQVPRSLEDLSPENQVKDTTAGTARIIGGATGQSPIKVEEFIKGTLGGVGSQALHISDRVLAGLDIIPKDQIGGQNIVEAIVARFRKARGGEANKEGDDKLRDILQKQADERFRLKQEAELIYEEFKSLEKDEANKRARELKRVNPELYTKLKDVIEDEKLGLTYSDRLIKQLGVTNGERAQFIWEELQTMKTDDEKNAYVKELRRKKIISDEVIKQLKKLKNQ